jgi:hypothetical protein
LCPGQGSGAAALCRRDLFRLVAGADDGVMGTGRAVGRDRFSRIRSE